MSLAAFQDRTFFRSGEGSQENDLGVGMKRLLTILGRSFTCAASLGLDAAQGMQTGQGLPPASPLSKIDPGGAARIFIHAAPVRPKTPGLPLFCAGRAGFFIFTQAKEDIFGNCHSIHEA